jgi:hypothetical protein
MKCPYCGHANPWRQDECQNCQADIGYLSQRVFLGRQFVFFEASEAQPIRVDLTPAGAGQAEERRFTRPAIVSRHAYHIGLGGEVSDEGGPAWPWFRSRERDPLPPPVLPALEFATLDLVTVVTERKIYRPGDEVHIFAVGLDAANQEAELELKLAGQRVYHTRVRLNQAGLYLGRFADLEEGEYLVIFTLPGRATARAECSFSCAEFSLSPLTARLEAHSLEGQRLSFVLNLTRLSAPYDGPLELALRSGQRLVKKQAGQAQAGRLAAEFELGWTAWESLTIEVTTPDGNTAALALPNSGWVERERISLSRLDPPVEAGLLPFVQAEGTIRGLHYAHQPEEDTPFVLLDLVADQGRIQVRRDAPLVHLVVFDPLDGQRRPLEFPDVRAGDVLSFEVGSPYAVFTLGAFMEGALPYETWGVVIRPVALEAWLDVPDEALPGSPISARIRTDRPAHCLLLVYDARLEHEDPLPRLAQRIFQQVRDSTTRLAAQQLQAVAGAAWNQMLGWQLPPTAFGRVLRGGPMLTMAFSQGADTLTVPREVAVEEAIPANLALLVAPRQDFPELAYIELFPVEGTVDKLIRLGDQIGTWRCRGYFFREHDYVSLTRDIQAGLDLYAELDLPAIVGQGDHILAAAHYHAPGPARLTVTTPTGQIEQDVAGDGMLEFLLTMPGRVTVHIATGDGADTSERRVDAPGQETVTASRLALLRRGESVDGKRVLVYPSMAPLLQETVEALIRYPFG